MGYTLLGINMGRASKFFRLVAHLGAWWMVLDMVLDCFTTITYWTLCQEGKLECWMWPLGVLFIALPTIVSTLITYTFGWPYPEEQILFRDTLVCFRHKIARGPLYFLTTPLSAILLTSRALCGGNTEDEEKHKVLAAYTKLPEVLCEALPQAALTWYYLSTTGFPWEQEDAALSTWIPLLSNISSTVMVIVGLVTGVKACCLLETDCCLTLFVSGDK